MDGHDRRRQNEPPQYGNPSERFPQGPELPRKFSDGSADRLRQPGLLPRSGSSSRDSAPTISIYGYYNEQTPSFPAAQPVDQMSYQSEYTEESRQQQAAFTRYSPNMPYGVSQQPAASVMYESPQQFQQRQAVPMQMLSETSSFYAAESMSAQAPSSMHGAAVGSIGLSQPQSEGLEEPPATLSPVDMGYRRCNTELRQVFQHILNGTLITASQHLLKLSEWLLSHVEDMELTIDGTSHEKERMDLWDNFNNAWLALFQKQKDSMEDFLQADMSPLQPQLLTFVDIKKMSDRLIKLNDEYLERHGLVNYQCGVLEDDILKIVGKCLDLLPNSGPEYEGCQRASMPRQPPPSR